jgi:choline dehydrogenase-like flavoprotein
MQKRLHDWGYNTEPEEELDGRSLECARGKVIGGSSAINAMAYVRGHRGDFDRWASNGLGGFSYAKVLPYFKRQESWEDGESEFRGGTGPLATSKSTYADPLVSACVEAGLSAGHPFTNDYNGEQQEGFGILQSTIRSGRRSSASEAYLHPVLTRPNLTVVTRALVTGLEFKGDRAVGLAYATRTGKHTVHADREIILSSGVINTPQILMLSGIGDPDELTRLGIKPRAALRGVGKNLQDHLTVAVEFERRGRGPFVDHMRIDRLTRDLGRAYFLGRGFATSLPSGWTAFLRTPSAGDCPNVQLIFRAVPMTAAPWLAPVKPAFQDGFAIRTSLLRPESRGRVTLRSDNPSDPVSISQSVLDSNKDWTTVREGLRLIREIASQPALQPFIACELAPGPRNWSEGALDDHIRATASTAHHPLGTCRMGGEDDSGAVLDPEFCVRGVRCLRVVDASAMPDLVGGNLNAPVMMLAEMAADLIQGRGTGSAASRQR